MNHDQEPVKINEKSYLSIGLILAILGGALRVESIASKSQANHDEITKLHEEMKIVNEMNTRLARIEGKLDQLKIGESK